MTFDLTFAAFINPLISPPHLPSCMAQRFRPVIEVDGNTPITHCLRLSISQAIFDHHHFEIVVPHETLEGADGNGFFQQAHHNLCGKSITRSQPDSASRGVSVAHE